MAKRITPQQAQELIEKQGYVYVDVRSVPEFQAGHPSAAYNVPLLHWGAQGMSPNDDFLRVMESRFPKDAKLIVGCKAGGRSMRAARMLEAAGFSDVVDQRAGFEGATDASGQVMEPGWRPSGLPTSQATEPNRSYEELLSKSK